VELRASAGLQPGAVIRKKYEILGEIGRGGMGAVYKARHLIWNEEKALKVLTAAGEGAQQGLRSLMAEAQIMRQLHHPNIVRVEDADYTEDDQPFVVMEYVQGESLRDRLKRAGTLAPAAALRIAGQVSSALAAAHQRGIIHRDIKPQNILLSKNADGSETVKVIDFGIAKVREEAGLGFTGMLTSTTGMFVGTVAYASPEQALGMRGSDLDGRTDLYSLGLVLYEMLSGRLPFAGSTPLSLLMERVQVAPAPLDRPGLPVEVVTVVMTALAKDRENRYRSADEMERAIAAALEGVSEKETVLLETPQAAPVRNTPHEEQRGTRAPAQRPTWSRPLAYGLIALALLAGALAVRRIMSRGSPPITHNPGPPEPPGGAKPPGEPGKVRTRANPVDGLTYVSIPAGAFKMGCSPGDEECESEETPQTDQTVAGFWLGQTEVTQAAWKKVMRSDPSHFKGEQLPVEEVDWNQAVGYCKAIGGRLPTEEEWEYAARAGAAGARYGQLDAVAWYATNSASTTHPVGLKQPNAFGLYDMLGNVWEFTASDEDPSLQKKILRGGSYTNNRGHVRASVKGAAFLTGHAKWMGFRCVAEFR